eukprot:m.506064 g.506064  ORF g.506064 m.506064 type:complete len:64 (+) comp21869_c0_seq4:115-306(+)
MSHAAGHRQERQHLNDTTTKVYDDSVIATTKAGAVCALGYYSKAILCSLSSPTICIDILPRPQ